MRYVHLLAAATLVVVAFHAQADGPPDPTAASLEACKGYVKDLQQDRGKLQRDIDEGRMQMRQNQVQAEADKAAAAKATDEWWRGNPKAEEPAPR